jgi:hypothetical protein
MTTETSHPIRWTAWTWILLVPLLALALAACAPAAGPGIATAGGSQQAASTEANPKPAIDPADAGIAYAQCMRDNGVLNFPDPGPEGIMLTRGSGISMTDPKYQAAVEACRELRPAGTGAGMGMGPGGPPGFGGEETALKFAQCMREQGVTNFPDPSSGGRMVISPGQGGMDPNNPRFQAAMQTCRAAVMGENPR